MKVKPGFGWFRRNSSQEDRSMPGKTRGGRTLAFPPAYPHTHKCPCENVGAEERSIRRGKGSVSATRESALFTFQEAFATLYTLHRAIICIPGANTPPMLRRKGRTLSFRNTGLRLPPPPPTTPPLPLAFVRKETGPKGNNGYGKTTKHEPLLHWKRD